MARLRKFDKKFGDGFIKEIPACPGVYLVYSGSDELIYVGKAKNLRRRLSQYRNAKRCKKHHKMRAIVADAAKIEHRECETELDALVLETRLIQEHRPRWNVSGAFYFLYPMIGVRQKDGSTWFCYTAHPEKFPEFSFHGAFRSRFITGESFFSLMKLLAYVGHRVPQKAKASETYSYVFGFRQLPEDWAPLWSVFWKGASKEALERLALALVENAAARRKSSEIQEHLDALTRFWRHEAKALARAIERVGGCDYPVPQRERDVLFLKYRQVEAS